MIPGYLFYKIELKICAARRALAICNHLPNPQQRRKHASRIFTHMNYLRKLRTDMQAAAKSGKSFVDVLQIKKAA